MSTFPLRLSVTSCHHPSLHSFPTRRSSDLHVFPEAALDAARERIGGRHLQAWRKRIDRVRDDRRQRIGRSEEHTSELQSLRHLVCRLLLEKKKEKRYKQHTRDQKNYIRPQK